MSAGYRQNFGQADAGGIVPGAEAGTIYVPGIGWQRITDWKERPIYDMEQLPINIAAGQTFTFFRNLQIAGVPKTRLQTNMDTPSQLPSGWRAIVFGLHVMCPPGTLQQDVSRIMGGGYVRFETGGQKLEFEGPAFCLPSPYGLTGFSVSDGNAVPREYSQVNNGVPSPAAMGRMSVPIDLVDEMTFQATVQFPVAVVLDAISNLYFILRAWIQQPVR